MGDKAEEMKGRAKEALGDLTDDDEMRREGKVEKGAARFKDKTDDAVDKVRDKMKDAIDR